MPRMEKAEYDRLIEDEHICRIAFKGDRHPYIAPFLYVFDGRFMYFLSTRYGKKVQYFRDNPMVVVEVERYSPDLSHFSFVALPGRLVEVVDPGVKSRVRTMFIDLIKKKGLSQNVLSALGYSPGEPVESLESEERNSVWKLESVRVDEILGLKSQE
ncbi:MAG: pyridoxamine 5'-phosphate oxidase family protein [Methanotrichaceae archaeon]|nr:pyridoxamine 5'-phosphate oxidase family protein [Methanotrichaceae archaeon]